MNTNVQTNVNNVDARAGGGADEDDTNGVELYPWALVKKHGRRMDHDVSIHMVAATMTTTTTTGMTHSAGGHGKGNAHAHAHAQAPTASFTTRSSDLVGGLFDFERDPSFRSRHGFDAQNSHSHTIVYTIECKHGLGREQEMERRKDPKTHPRPYSATRGGSTNVKGDNNDNAKEIPCCLMVRDPVNRDVFDITIAPGIDPLLIICYMAAHSKMVSDSDVIEPRVKS